jgi:zinc protease
MASTIASTGGVGSLSVIELRKLLAGKSVGVSPVIGDLTEGLRGSSSVQDLQTMFELTYLYFTQPRRDADAFASMKSRFSAMVANRANDPDQAMSDTLTMTLTQHHPRVKLFTSEVVEQLDLDAALAFYRDRFADASDFTFALAGSFQLEQIRPLVLQYLGGLPAMRRHESFRDNGIRPPTGVVRREVHRGQDAKSRTQIVFTGPFDWTRENRYSLQALSDVLSMRLRNVLREDLGGTYGVGVNAQGSRDPIPDYRVSIGFGADPARLQELSDQTFEVLREMREKGPTADEVAKVQETQRREYETSLRENGFWTQQLLFRAQYGLDPGEILTFPKLVDGLKPAAVREAAQRYLRLDNYVQVSLLPQSPVEQKTQAP